MSIKIHTGLNILGDFSDPHTEETYISQEMQRSIRFIGPISVLLGVFYALTLIPDYLLSKGQLPFWHMTACKGLFLVFVFIFSVFVKHTNQYRKIVYWITAYEFLFSISFLCVFYVYPSPNFLIQVMGLILFFVVLCMVPNRWLYNQATILFTNIGFIILSLNHPSLDLPPSEFIAGIVYMITVSALCSIMSYRDNYYRRMQYQNNHILEYLSTTDYLSKVYNRLKFEQLFEQWMNKAIAGNLVLSIILFDIDNFKRINDKYGHPTGDKVVAEVASLVSANIREDDVIARWGGDEFILLLPRQNKVSAVNLASRLCSKIAEHSFQGMNEKVTCSFGVAEKMQKDDFNSLLARTDKMLYLAKSSGKNTVKA